MEFSIQPTKVSDYARLQAAQGGVVVERGGVYWKRIRPFFYRPLLDFEALSGVGLVAPARWPAAFQYATKQISEANSSLNFLTANDLPNYSLGAVSHNRRRLIKNAARLFSIKQIREAAELKEHGHGVYLSFYERTAYSFKADRTRKTVFDEWVDGLFSCPGAFVLGAYGDAGLMGVSVSFWIGQTLIYTTLFAESDAQRKGVCEILLHELRMAAAATRGIERILIRAYQGGNSRDQYYLLRGCELTSLPARLEIDPVLDWTLQRFFGAKHAQLRGVLGKNGEAVGSINGSAGQRSAVVISEAASKHLEQRHE